MNSKNVDASSFDMIRIYFFGEKNVAISFYKQSEKLHLNLMSLWTEVLYINTFHGC